MKNQTLNKYFLILSTISNSKSILTLKELQEKLHIPKGTLSRLLNDLCEIGFLEKTNYHSFQLGFGLILLGQNAILNMNILYKINPMVRIRATLLGIEAAIAVLEQDQLIYLYRTNIADLPENNGIPCNVPLYRSNIAMMLLAQNYPLEKAVQKFFDAQPGSLPHKTKLQIKKDMEKALSMKYCYHIEENKSWNLCVSFKLPGDHICGLSFFDINPHAIAFENILKEIFLLKDEIEEYLLNQ